VTGFFQDLDRLAPDPPRAQGGSALRERHLTLLGEFARELSGVGDVHDLGKLVLRRLLALTAADRALLFLATGDAPARFVLGLDREGDFLSGDGERPEHEIVARVIETGEPALIGAAVRDGSGGEAPLSRSSCICVPLDAHRGRIGAVFLECVAGGGELGDEDLLVARLVAVQASQSIELLRFEEEKRETDRALLENEHLRRLSRRTADEARVIEELNRELKGRTEKLTAATAFLSSILESSTEYAIIATDLEGNINAWNAGAVRLYGFGAAEVVGCARLHALFSDADKSAGLFREMVEAAGGPAARYEGEVRRLRKDESSVAVHAAATAIRNAEGEIIGWLDVSRDITRECEMRRQMLLAEKMAALGTLCAGVAHEFNNLLQGIVGFLEHAQQSGDDAIKDRAITVSLSGARRAADLTRQLQAVARPAVSKPAPVALSDLVAEALALVEKVFATEGVEIVAEHAFSAMAVVDRSRMQQVLLNLVTNARHAVHGSKTKRVTVRTSQEGAWCVLSVTDTGCGMSPEVQRRIFEPFFTTKGALGGKVYDGKVHGTGLGLAISQGIVAESGGRIELSSQVGRGTTFRVLLPKSEDAAAEAKRPVEKGPRAGRAETRLRVLVVDDEAPIRELLRSVLSMRGHEVQCVGDGEEGLQACLAGSFDVVVADYQMPRMNGAAFLAALDAKGSAKKLRKILVTGLPPSEFELPPNLDLLLEKPYGVQDIIKAVEEGAVASPSGAGR
jgi:two-component system cell cycle sensor histidine kinase/response regulator CckA